MKILITGGAGFIASHVADALIDRHHEVHVIDDLSTGQIENVPKGAVFREMDIRSDAAAALVRDEGFEVLVHHAAQMDVRRSVADPAFDADVNLLGFLRLMEAGRRGSLSKVLFASTGGAIYGEPGDTPPDEDHLLRPLSPYGITKLCTEHYLEYYRKQYGIRCVVLRYANVFGPRQNAQGEAGVVAIFIGRLLMGRPCTIYGDGEQTRDYVFVDDVVQANVEAMAYHGSGTFNVGTGVETSVRELFGMLRDRIDPTAVARYGDARPGEQLRSVLACESARRELGWEPAFDLSRGLDHTVDWFRKRLRCDDRPHEACTG